MSNAYTPILVGVTFSVSEILLLSKMAKFPFLTMDYSGGRDLFSFGDIATFKNGQISLSDNGL